MTEPADMALVERVLRDSGVDTAVPAPDWSGWMEAVLEALVEWIRGKLPGLPDLSGLGPLLGPAARVLVGLLLVVILYALFRAAWSYRAAGPRPAAASVKAVGAAPPPDRDRAGWRAEVDRRLEAGDLAGALEALWWWFARSIAASAVDPSWTSRELLARCGRGDLFALAAALDRLLYGVHRPEPDDLRSFLGRAETVLS